MGSTSKTRKTSKGVTKTRGNSGSAVGAGTGGGEKSFDHDQCFFALSFKQNLLPGSSVSPGNFASIVLVDDQNLKVIIGSSPVGDYSESKKKLLINCIGEGFVYEGKVVSTDNLTADIKVKGHG